MITSKQNIVFFDVDNTLFDGYTQQYFVRFLKNKKYIDFSHLLVGVAWFVLYRLRLIRNEEWGMNMLLSRLKGWSREQYDVLFDEYVKQIVLRRLYSAAMTQIKIHKDSGAIVVLLSTSLKPIIKRIAEHVGADQYIATRILFDNGICSGKIDGRTVTGFYKYQWAKGYLAERDDVETIYAYADHFTDYKLLKSAHFGYVINPNIVEKVIARMNKLIVLNYQ